MYKILGADGREYGPVSAAQLRAWVSEGRANGATPVLAAGASSWKTLAKFPELSGSFPPSTIAPANWAPRQTHPLATTGMVLGIVSLTVGLCCCHGVPFNILGLIFSAVALVRVRSEPERYEGGSVALAGLIMNLISLALSVAMLGFVGIATLLDELSR